MRVVVTGGTGCLGRALVACLCIRGHEVLAVSRRPPQAVGSGHPKVTYLRGDVCRQEDMASAVQDAEAVVHAATTKALRPLEPEVVGTATVLGAARRVGAHFVYISIVGVDRNRFSYYRAKVAAERVVGSAVEGWTILRATQFFDLVDRFLGFGVFPATPNLAFQPVDVAEVAERLAAAVENGPAGRLEDFGGPEVLGIRDLADTWSRITGRRTLLVPVPAVGVLGDFDRGWHLCPDHRAGNRTWEEWLRSRVSSAP